MRPAAAATVQPGSATVIGPATVPDGLDAGVQGDVGRRAAGELPGFAVDEDGGRPMALMRAPHRVAVKVSPVRQSVGEGGEAVAARQAVAAPGAHEGGGKGWCRDGAVQDQETLSRWERA